MAHPSISSLQAKIAILWARGLSIASIAGSLSLPQNTAASELRRARSHLGSAFVPHRPRLAGTPLKRPTSRLDELTAVGQELRASREELGSRSNIHQNAETRGWLVRVSAIENGWRVTALARVPIRAIRKSQAKAPQGTLGGHSNA